MSLKKGQLAIQYNGGEVNTFGAVSVDQPVITTPSIPDTSDGTGSNQSKHSLKANVATSTGGVSLDLTAVAGGLTGANIDFSANGGSIKRYIIQNTDTTNSITLSQPGSHGWTAISGAATGLNLTLGPGDLICGAFASGRPVTATDCLLTLTSNSGTPNLRVTFEG